MTAIDRYQFKLQMDRLIDVFGEKHFSEQRELMLWECCRGVRYPLVIAVVDNFIRKSKSAPLPIEFAEAIAAAEKTAGDKRYFLGEIQPKAIAKCFDCGDSGFIELKRKPEHEEWAKWGSGSAPCHCARGKLVSENKKHELGPQFSDRWRSSYTVIPAYTGRGDDDGGLRA
jgi:hypothetical protein